MWEKIKSIAFNNRISFNILTLKDFSIGRNLEIILKSIEDTFKKEIIGNERRIIDDYSFSKDSREIFISIIIEVPIIIPSLKKKGAIYSFEKKRFFYPNQ